MKKKINTILIKSILHNDREVLINPSKIAYASPVTREETGEELLKVVFVDGKEIDIIDKLHELNEKVMSISN